jgi:regulator of sigma E protease
MFDTLSTLFFFIVAIIILVTVHEFGHYLAAIWTKTRAEIFSIGMGKRLFGWNKLDGFTLGDINLKDKDYGNHTDWRLSLLPIGGYVKISGMVDESMDEETVRSAPKKHEFRSKTALQKIFILSAGVIFNIILAFLLFSAANINTEDEIYDTTTIGWVDPYGKPYEMGFRQGDEVVAINGMQPENFQQIINSINRDDVGVDREIDITRKDGKSTQIFIPYDSVLKFIAARSPIEFVPEGVVVVLGQPVSGSNAEEAGLMAGDTVLSVNDTRIESTRHFQLSVGANKGNTIDLKVSRSGEVKQIPVKVNDKGLIGINIGSTYTGDISYDKVSIGESFARGWNSTADMFTLFFQSIEQIFAGSIEAKQAIGGPIMIAQQAKMMGDLGIGPFMIFLASLSISLAIINILPLPVLDGGHILIVIIERIKGSELSETLKMRIQAVGMVMMFLLMAVVIFVDLTR